VKNVSGEAWIPPPDAIPRPVQQVHIWRVLLDVAAVNGANLSRDEHLRADRLVHLQHRHRFVAMRSALRSVLAGYLQIAPNSVTFAYGEKGKPRVAEKQNSFDLRFNVSHSGGLGLIGVVCGHEIGVDVETRQHVLDYMGVAKRFFSAREYRGLLALPEEFRQKAFLRCWTRKESYVKALGKGLACSLRSFSVSVSPEMTDNALLETECASVHHVRDVAMPDECFASLTSEGEDRPRSCWTYDE
jgi:4'-phosphopantetheinyl transferase